ncbi:hypothetical protein MLD38_038841 [Melastoma candidum]|uniref:Uncharacterized protein n=1 Tax=Melastoma candidum TaxID=119954 RepID=A0ACB9L1G7_9MYRT|nr:hypothetical protein MLD38_038841 [Melastoma candidum]
MGVVTNHLEIVSSVPPEKIFKAFVLEADVLLPKIVPQIFQSFEILEGDGGAGTVKKITFGDAVKFKHAKHRIDLLDKEKFIYHYSWVEGDILSLHHYEKISYEMKVESGPDGGSIFKNATIYHTHGDGKVSEELLKEDNEKIFGLFKAVEGYVLANPAAY